MCVTARLDVTPKTTEQNRIVRISKSETEVTNTGTGRKFTGTGILGFSRTEDEFSRFCNEKKTYISACSL